MYMACNSGSKGGDNETAQDHWGQRGALGVIGRLPHLLGTSVLDFRFAQAERRASHRSGRLLQLTYRCDPSASSALNQPYVISDGGRRESSYNERVLMSIALRDAGVFSGLWLLVAAGMASSMT